MKNLYPSYVLEAIRDTADKGGKTLIVTDRCSGYIKSKVGSLCPTLGGGRALIVYPVENNHIVDLSNVVQLCGVSLVIVDGVVPLMANNIVALSEKYRTKFICL